jgi:SpoVK/Ycf46/Vps4 family AAA+-type ATPase
MSKRVKKRFNSEVNVIDFQTYLPVKKLRVLLHARNGHQAQYLEKLQDDNKNIVFAVGPAGTGKTMLAVQVGVKLFQEGKFDKIIVTRPAVSVDEDLGFLPGTMQEKMAPWTRPIFDVLGEYYLKKDIEDVLSGDPDEVIDEPVIVPEVQDPIETPEPEEKAGRVISKKNRKALEDTMNALKSALSEIEKLLAIEVATTDDEEVDEKSNYVVVPKSLIENLKADLRNENRLNDKVLSIFKKLD